MFIIDPMRPNGIIKSRSHYNNKTELIHLSKQLICYTKGKKCKLN